MNGRIARRCRWYDRCAMKQNSRRLWVAPTLAAALALLAVPSTGALHAQTTDECPSPSPRCRPWTNVLNGAEFYGPEDPENGVFQPESHSFRFVPPGSSTEVWGGSVSFFVEETGSFTIDASSPEILIRLALYEGNFDPESPDANVIAGDEGENFETVTAQLTAGVIYYAVVSALGSDAFGSYSVDVAGDGGVVLNSCFLEPDEIYPSVHVFDDANGSVDVQGFCVAANWKDFEERTGRGTVVGHRSRDSVIFSFFDEDNWS